MGFPFSGEGILRVFRKFGAVTSEDRVGGRATLAEGVLVTGEAPVGDKCKERAFYGSECKLQR